MRRQGYPMRRGHSHGAIPEEQRVALLDEAVAELPGLLLDNPEERQVGPRLHSDRHR